MSKFIGTRISTLQRAATILRPDTITKGAEIDHSKFAAGVRRWRGEFRRRDSRRTSAAVQLSTFAAKV
jgi:hypothetical protein